VRPACHKQDNAEDIARNVALRLKNVLKREQFEVAIQAVVGSKVHSRRPRCMSGGRSA